MQRRKSKGTLQAQPEQLGLFKFDFGGRNHKEDTQVKTVKAGKQIPASTSSVPNKDNKGKVIKATKGTEAKQKKRGRIDNKSPSDPTIKPPSKKQNTGKMSETNTTITPAEEDKASTNADLLALEKRLFAGFTPSQKRHWTTEEQWRWMCELWLGYKWTDRQEIQGKWRKTEKNRG